MNVGAPLRALGLFLLAFAVFSLLLGPARTGTAQVQSTEEKIKMLEKIISDLQDSNAMLMENLANCTKELQEQGRKEGLKPDEAGKLRLIQDIRLLLQARADLNFLSRLDEEQLQTLLEAIRGRLG